jgi:hypothetical protein
MSSLPVPIRCVILKPCYLCNIISIAVVKAVNPYVRFFFSPPVPGGNRNSQIYKFTQYIEMALNYCT